MSDPQPLPSHNKPQRAEPIQPDAPGRGANRTPDPDAEAAHADPAAKAKKQSDTALDNVRQGYD